MPLDFSIWLPFLSSKKYKFLIKESIVMGLINLKTIKRRKLFLGKILDVKVLYEVIAKIMKL